MVAVVPLDDKAPIVLFCMLIVPVPDEFIPTIAAPDPVDVIVIAFVPLEAPIVFPVTVPILTFPAETTIPHNVPAPVAVVAEVPRLIAVTVLPWTEEAVVVPTARSIPLKIVATVPAMV
jgi:hypothetical protein